MWNQIKAVGSTLLGSPKQERGLKNINDYNSDNCKVHTNPNYLTPCVTPEILNTRNNIIIYMDSVLGNPLEQKYVVRWILYFELAQRIKTWNKNDLIIWFIDTYQKYSKNIQKINNEEPIDYKHIPNKQIVMPIVSNIDKILSLGNDCINNNAKSGICFTTRKSGNNINPDRKLRNISIDLNLSVFYGLIKVKYISKTIAIAYLS